MEAFFKDVDPNLAESIQKEIPDSILSEFVTNYKGPDSVDGHLEGLVTLLTSLINQPKSSVAQNPESKKKVLGLLALTYSSLNDWSAATSAWRSIVRIDDEKTLSDHPTRDLAAMFNFGIALNQQKEYPEAEEVFRRLLPMLEAVPVMGKTSQQYLGSLSALILAVGKQGRVEEARKIYFEHSKILNECDGTEYNAHAAAAKRVLSEVEHDARER